MKARLCIGEFIAELMGTFVLMVINNGVVAVYVLSKRPIDVFAMGFVGGVGALVGITTSATTSGGHINPAVTVAFAVSGKFAWKKVPYYMLAQYLGSFLASAVVFLLNYGAIHHFDGGVRSAYGNATSTGQIFATYPASHVSLTTAFFDQVFGTSLLLFAVMAVIDAKGLNVPGHLQPLMLSFIICAIGISHGLNCGAILNPARDVPPRIFTALAGYGWEPFRPLNGKYWFVAGMLGPHLGASMGVFCYNVTIDAFHGDVKNVTIVEEGLQLKPITDKIQENGSINKIYSIPPIQYTNASRKRVMSLKEF